jgi:hypothetical protein
MTQPRSERLVFLLGPSAIGNSTAMEYAKGMMPHTAFVELDQLAEKLGRTLGLISQNEGAEHLLVNQGRDAFLQIGIDAASAFSREAVNRSVVIDVGAGFLDASKIGMWLSQYTSVALCAPPRIAYDRMRLRSSYDQRRFIDYMAQEFSTARTHLYEGTTYQINANCGAELLGQRLICLLVGLVTSAGAGGEQPLDVELEVDGTLRCALQPPDFESGASAISVALGTGWSDV